ncbi:hypothetical protein HDV00_001619 [Rhizophlyctis rosea]|nr:hypothetical protein HDV00_001619 [Rhizophlyctis rosea]
MADFFDPLARSDSESSSEEDVPVAVVAYPQTLLDPAVITLTSLPSDLQPYLDPDTEVSPTTTTLQYSVHTPGRHLARELAFIFPRLPVNPPKKRGKKNKGPEQPDKQLLVIPVFQKLKYEPLPTTNDSLRERAVLLAHFKSWTDKICNALEEHGHWADYVDPESQLPVRTTPGSTPYDAVDAVVRLLRYPSLQDGTSRVLVHPEWGTRNLPGTLFTNAPLYILRDVIEECSAPPEQPQPVPIEEALEEALGGEGMARDVPGESSDEFESLPGEAHVSDHDLDDDVGVDEREADSVETSMKNLLVLLPNSDSEEELNIDQSYERRPRQFTPALTLELLPKHEHFDEDVDRVVAIFVTRFDTLRGQVIDYKYPEDADVTGLEYTTLPSGSHNLETDVIYFEHKQAYGVAALASHMISEDETDARERERGARTGSIGIISTVYAGLHRHLPFLKEQAARFVVDQGIPDELKAYFRSQVEAPGPRVGIIESIGLRDYQHEHPIMFLPEFLDYFGPAIFVLWKYGGDDNIPPTPRFTVNDIDRTRFGTLMRVVDGAMEGGLPGEGEVESGMGRRNWERSGADGGAAGGDGEERERLVEEVGSGSGGGSGDVRDGWGAGEMGAAVLVIEFFQRLNTHILTTLHSISHSADPILRPCRIRNVLGLHPRHDIQFLRELCTVHHIPIDVVGDGKGGPMDSGTKRRRAGSGGWFGRKCRCCPKQPVEEVVGMLGDGGKGKRGRRRGSR